MEKFNFDIDNSLQEDFLKEVKAREDLGKELEAGIVLEGTAEIKKYPEVFSGEKHPYWEKNDYDYFKKFHNGGFSKQERIDRREKIKQGGETIEFFRDEGVTFYVVKKGDSINGIRNKLSKTEEFSYLKDPSYAHPSSRPKSTRNISAFNILPRHLKPGMYIPIPLEHKNRSINYKQFTNYCYQGLSEMKENSFYKDEIKEIVEEHGEKKLIQIMIAFARSETSANLEQAIGAYSFQRYEGDNGHHEYSFSMFHVLMAGPGIRARKRLNLTEGQCYHPANAAKLFLGYWLEKVCNKRGKFDASKIDPYFKMKSREDFRLAGRWYCGRSSYGTKLQKNFEYAEKRLKDVKIPPDGEPVIDFVSVEPVVVSTPILPTPEKVLQPEGLYTFEELSFYLAENKNPQRNITIHKDGEENLLAQIDRKNPKTKEVKRLEVNIERIALENEVTLRQLAIWLSGDPMVSGTVYALLESLNPEAEKNDFVFKPGQIARVPAKLVSVPNKKLENLVKIWYPEREEETAIDFVKRLNGRDPDTEIIRVGEVILIPALYGIELKKIQEKEIERQEKEKPINSESSFYRVGEGGSLIQVIKDAHWELKETIGKPSLHSDQELKEAEQRVQKYIRDIFGKNTYFPLDRVSVGSDKYGVYFRFQRRKHTSKKMRLHLQKNTLVESKVPNETGEMKMSVAIGKRGTLESAIKNANWEAGRPLKTDTQVLGLSISVEQYVNTIFGSRTVQPTDRIMVGKDKQGVYARFQRGKHISAPVRLK